MDSAMKCYGNMHMTVMNIQIKIEFHVTSIVFAIDIYIGKEEQLC